MGGAAVGVDRGDVLRRARDRHRLPERSGRDPRRWEARVARAGRRRGCARSSHGCGPRRPGRSPHRGELATVRRGGRRRSLPRGLGDGRAMTLPTFLGIGVPRAGTTWLHTLLSGHPQVYLPTRRKEVRFFDRYHERGVGWYETFFPPPDEALGYRAIGEISPQYLYCEACPERIAALAPDVKLLVMLRHPVDRAYSNYGFVVQRRNYRESFERFLETRPNAVEMGFYSTHLAEYLRTFGQDRILALVFERAVKGGADVRRTLGGFLGVAPEGFPDEVGKVNASTVPKHGRLANLAVKTGRTLRRNHLESVVDIGARLGGRRLIGKGTALPKLDPERKRELSRLYEGDFDELERLTGLDLGVWRT